MLKSIKYAVWVDRRILSAQRDGMYCIVTAGLSRLDGIAEHAARSSGCSMNWNVIRSQDVGLFHGMRTWNETMTHHV